VNAAFFSPRSVVTAFAALCLLFTLPAVSGAGEIAKKLTGDVKVNARTDESRRPVAPPSVIYIQDFDLGYDATQQDSGDGGRILGRVLPRKSQRNDPQRKARQLVELMSDSLAKGFAAKGIDARRCIPGTPLPGDGWLIRGVFTEIDQGRRVIRATIGFGAGASEMELYVSISDLAGNPDAPFIVFGTEKDPGKMPGAIVTMNPYVAAAKFVMQKNASEKDVKKTAAQIVDQVVNYMGKLVSKDAPSNQPAPR
jgi:hypothetical protein